MNRELGVSLILSHCVQLTSYFMDAVLLLSTSHDVYSVYCLQCLLFMKIRVVLTVKLASHGSLFIEWGKFSKVDVERKIPKQYHSSFFPPQKDAALGTYYIFSLDVHYDDKLK